MLAQLSVLLWWWNEKSAYHKRLSYDAIQKSVPPVPFTSSRAAIIRSAAVPAPCPSYKPPPPATLLSRWQVVAVADNKDSMDGKRVHFIGTLST